MSSTHVGKIETCLFGNRLILAIDQQWMKANNNQPLIFDVKIENKKMILEAQVSQ